MSRVRVKLDTQEVIRDGKRVFLSAQRFTIFCVCYFHGRVHNSIIADVLYAGRSDGGPLYADRIIGTQCCYMNEQLRCLGLRVNHSGYGHREVFDVARQDS